MTSINDILTAIYRDGSAILDSKNQSVQDAVRVGLVRESTDQGAFCCGNNRRYVLA